MNKKLLPSLLAINALFAFAFTPSAQAANQNPAHLATIVVGAAMAGGGVYWCVKSNKKEGWIKRLFRTIASLGLTAAGIILILESKTLHKNIEQKGVFEALKMVGSDLEKMGHSTKIAGRSLLEYSLNYLNQRT